MPEAPELGVPVGLGALDTTYAARATGGRPPRLAERRSRLPGR